METFNPEIMGIINATPDSFYALSRTQSVDRALYESEKIKKNGADWIDIGGESTRPGAIPITDQQDLDRVAPIIEAIKKNIDIKISVDTRHARVMQHALEVGVEMINDTHALSEPNSLEVVANSNIKITLMHMQGIPSNMQNNPEYQDNVINCINDFFNEKIKLCKKYGINKNRIILDPGFGFGKNYEHNWQILNNLDQFKSFNLPLMIGISRKSFIGQAINAKNPANRGIASTIAASIAMQKGANIIRTHDPKWVKWAVDIIQNSLSLGTI